MKAFFSTWLVAVSMLFLPALAATAKATQYDFHLIADTLGPFKEFRQVAISKNGSVAFVALQKTNEVGVFSGCGNAPLTTISRSGGGYFVAINDAGMVAFDRATEQDNSGGGLFKGNGGALTTVLSEGSVYYPSINNHGSVAFRRVFGIDGPPESFAFVSIGGRMTQIPDSFESCQPAINNQNTVMVGRCAPLVGSISISKSGERPTLILDSNGDFNSLYATTINNHGTIAFFGRKKSGEVGVFTVAGGKINTIASTNGPAPSAFPSFTSEIALNRNGKVAFSARLAPERTGIFTGPNAVTDKVIATGDALFGSTVTVIAFSRDGLNQNGELAFRATLANGEQVVVKATPVVN